MSYKQIQDALGLSNNNASVILDALQDNVKPENVGGSVALMALKMDVERWPVYEVMFAGCVLIKMLGVDTDAEE